MLWQWLARNLSVPRPAPTLLNSRAVRLRLSPVRPLWQFRFRTAPERLILGTPLTLRQRPDLFAGFVRLRGKFSGSAVRRLALWHPAIVHLRCSKPAYPDTLCRSHGVHSPKAAARSAQNSLHSQSYLVLNAAYR